MTAGRSYRACLVAILLVALAGCVAPAVNSGAFQQNAVAALTSAASEARTAAVALQARLDANVTQAYVNTVVTDSEDALGPIQASFGSVDPPARQDDRLRDQVTSVLGDTSDALATARIAVRRQDTLQMRRSVKELTHLADEMDQAQERLS